MVLMHVTGDSMHPTIWDGDMVMVDQSKTVPVDGRIFAMGIDSGIVVKRLVLMPGKVKLVSDNKEYPPLEVDLRGDLADSFRIIGQVIWFARELSARR